MLSYGEHGTNQSGGSTFRHVASTSLGSLAKAIFTALTNSSARIGSSIRDFNSRAKRLVSITVRQGLGTLYFA
jgi:hypothetical protein